MLCPSLTLTKACFYVVGAIDNHLNNTGLNVNMKNDY